MLRTSIGDAAKKTSNDDDEADDEALVVGEDSAFFELAQQKISSWLLFSIVLGVVLFVLDYAWIDNSNGLGLGLAFVNAVSQVSDSHEVNSLFLFCFCGFCNFCLSFHALPSICLLRKMIVVK